MSRKIKVILIISFLVLTSVLAAYFWVENTPSQKGSRGQVVELVFELDKKFEFGEYYFDLDNGSMSTYPLCFCLTEKNMFPPDCFGDLKYIFNNEPGIMCVPMHIAKGRCSVDPIKSSAYATNFYIPLEYSWIKPFEKIIMGVEIPEQAPIGAKLEVEVSFFKVNDFGKLVPYRKYTKRIVVINDTK